nr:MAG TPA: hypothetical protein [Caudoviricetes sp.]
MFEVSNQPRDTNISQAEIFVNTFYLFLRYFFCIFYLILL